MGQQLKVPVAKLDDLSVSPDAHVGEGEIKSRGLFDFPMCLMVFACPLHSQIKVKIPQRPVFWRSLFYWVKCNLMAERDLYG